MKNGTKITMMITSYVTTRRKIIVIADSLLIYQIGKEKQWLGKPSRMKIGEVMGVVILILIMIILHIIASNMIFQVGTLNLRIKILMPILPIKIMVRMPKQTRPQMN